MPSPSVTTPHLTDKIMFLIHLMQREMGIFADAMSAMEDRHLRDSVGLLLQQTTQYRNELQSLTQMLGRERNSGTPVILTEETDMLLSQESSDNTAEGLLTRCLDSEKKIMKVYRELLDEEIIPAAARKIIRQQLNGITYCIAQLKLLRKEPVQHS